MKIMSLYKEFQNLSIIDKITFLKEFIPEKFQPALIINQNNKLQQVIVTGFKSGFKFKNGEVKYSTVVFNKIINGVTSIDKVYKISWEDYQFPEINSDNHKFKIFINQNTYWFCFDQKNLANENSIKKVNSVRLINLSTVLSNEKDFLDVETNEFEKTFVRMSKNDDPNQKSIKDFMLGKTIKNLII